MKEQICVIGGGRWGENHIRTLYEMGNLAAVVEPDEHRLQELEEKYGMLGLTSLEEALEKAFDGKRIPLPDRKTHDDEFP